MAQVLCESADRDTTPTPRLVEPRWYGGLLSFRTDFPEDERTTPKPVRGLADASEVSGFAEIIHQISELASGDEEDEYGVLRPTRDAIQKTLTVLCEAYNVRQKIDSKKPRRQVVPRGSVTTDESGGLRIEWSGGGCAVRLVMGATEKSGSYVYHEVGKKYGTERVTGAILASWLKLID